MPFDSEVSKLQGEISQLEKEIAAIQSAIYYERMYSQMVDDIIDTLTGIKGRLSRDLEYKEMKLSMHRQKTRESGVKY